MCKPVTFSAVIKWTEKQAYDIITGSTVSLTNTRYTLLQENNNLKQSLATILDPYRLPQFKKYGEWIAVNRAIFDHVWSRQTADPLSDNVFWDILTDQDKYQRFLDDKFRYDPPPVPPKPIEMAMQYPQSKLLRQVCQNTGSLFWAR